MEKNESKQELMKNLKLCHDVIFEIAETNEKIDNITNQLHLINEKREKCIKRYNEISEYVNTLEDGSVVAKEKCPHPTKSFATAVLYALIAGVIVWVVAFLFIGPFANFLAIVLGIIVLKFGYNLWEEDAKNAVKIKNEVLPSLDKFIIDQEKLLEQSKQKFSIILDSDNTKFMLSYIPSNYATVDCLSCVISLLENQRADSFKEALNLYEDIKHKEEVVALQEEAVRIQTESAETQKAHFEKQENLQKQNIKQNQELIDNNKEILKQQKSINARTKKISKQVRFGNAASIIHHLSKK